MRATLPSPAISAAAIVASFCIWLKAAGTVITVPVSEALRISSGRYPNSTRKISAEHSSGVIVRSAPGRRTGVLVPIKRLNTVAAFSGLRAALSYARLPTYLLLRLSMKIADGVTSF